MDQPETEKNGVATEDTAPNLNRNRSFKSKQLVRSQAIREAQSPPRAQSPAAARSKGDADKDARRHPVAIQITSGGGDCENSQGRDPPDWARSVRADRWLGRNHSDPSRDLLSNNPRVACVCGSCATCPHCRGRRRRQQCPTKQDSGIVCSDDCPDCSDNETTGAASRKTSSLDVDDSTAYCRCSERRDKPKSFSFTRTDSDDRPEPTGPELVAFIKETLNKNARDRSTLLRIERELYSLINDAGRCLVRFPVMTSYGRMLVHRCASLFELSHHIDQLNKNSVVVSKSGTCGGRIPCTSFKAWCTATFPPSPQRFHDQLNAKSILKRDALVGSDGVLEAVMGVRSKSLEQREKDYERVRRRIFSTGNFGQNESEWPWHSGPIRLLTPEAGRNKLLKVQSLEGPGCGPRPPWRARGPVSKSHSFSGYGNNAATNNNSLDIPPQPRLLSRQGDLASSSWRLSPSSSGYKTLSLRSTDSVTPSPTGGASPEPCAAVSGDGPVVWAVTDMASVPLGAIVLHPQTRRPLTNVDGSIYHFDPNNPPVFYDPAVYDNNNEQKMESNEKRRGRLEKQHSFIDNESECQSPEDCTEKGCNECRKQDEGRPNSSTIDGNNISATNSPHSSPKKTSHESLQSPTNEEQFEGPSNRSQSRLATPTNDVNHSFDDKTEVVQQNQSLDQSSGDNANNTYANSVSSVDNDNDNQRYEPPITTNEDDVYSAATNQNEAYDASATNHGRVYEMSTNQEHVYDTSLANHDRGYATSTNNHVAYVSPINHAEVTSFEATNGRASTDAQQRHYPSSANHSQKCYEQREHSQYRPGTGEPSQRPSRAVSLDGPDIQLYHPQQPYAQHYGPEQVASPQMGNHLMHQEMMSMQQAMAQAKISSVPVADANMRAMALSNVVYPGTVPHGYPYMNQGRIDQQMAPALYHQPMVQQALEEPKPIPASPHPAETTFRIDPSYPYAAIDYTAACGACVDPNSVQPRSYSVPYGQMEVPQAVMPSAYPVGNVILSQNHLQAYPTYQESVPWAGVPHAAGTGPKYYVPDVYSMVQYPAPYPQYNIMYPQMVSQPYQLCQPLVPAMVAEKPEITQQPPPTRRNTGSYRPRSTPHHIPKEDPPVPETKGPVDGDVESRIERTREILNQREREREAREGNGWGGRRRNSGSGILGSYPNGRMSAASRSTSNDESQLSTAAQAIVNTIRFMQAKTYQNEPRRHQQDNSNPHHREDGYHNSNRQEVRPDFRQRRYEREDRGEREPFSGPRHPRPEPRGPFGRDAFRPQYAYRQMSPNTWCRRSPGPLHPTINNPRRPHPDSRNHRR